MIHILLFVTFMVTSVKSLWALRRFPSAFQQKVEESSPTFSYDPSAIDGPANWSSITPSFATCGSGTAQSPIDFPCPGTSGVETTVLDEEPVISTTKTNFNFVTTTLNFELDCAEEGTCGTTEFNGIEFDLINIHFHSPSEHHIGGVSYPLEAHMVHQSSDGALLVVSVLFSYVGQGDCITNAPSSKRRNRALSSILFKVIRGKTQFVVNTGAFLEEDTSFCMYPGSLTTPPCTEGVTWILAETRQIVSPLQVRLFRAVVDGIEFGNARPVQALNGRTVACALEVLSE